MDENTKLSKKTLRLLGVLGYLTASLPAFAQLNGTLSVQLQLSQACNLVGSSTTNGINFGTLDFGSAPSTFTGTLTAQATDGEGGAGPTELVCSPDIDGITVEIDGGDNAGEGGSIGTGARALTNGTGDYVPYDVYSDAGHNTAYGIGSPGATISIPSDGSPFVLPVYGLINKTSSTAITSGSYQDTLTITISW